MPFGPFTGKYRLGIANAQVLDAIGWAVNILKLPANIPIYQQQIVHNTIEHMGPKCAAEWCGAAASENMWSATDPRSQIIREVSAHDHMFGRRNISPSPSVNGRPFQNYTFNTYSQASFAQIFYTYNEPDGFSCLTSQMTNNGCDCWSPINWTIDADQMGCNPSPDSSFFINDTIGQGANRDCNIAPCTSCAPVSTDNTQCKRIRPEALARLFLRLKKRADTLPPPPRNHIFLPPSAAALLDNILSGTLNPYWKAFFDRVTNEHPPTINSCEPEGVPLANLKVLHNHHYSCQPIQSGSHPPPNCPDATYYTQPLKVVAHSTAIIKRGVNRIRDTYIPGQPLPLDYLLSELGSGVVSDVDPKKWAGGFGNVRDGLSYWNSLLYWLVSWAPLSTELNLQTGNVVYSCIHAPTAPPFVLKAATTGLPITQPNDKRSQWFFNLDFWDTYFYSPDINDPNDPNNMCSIGLPDYSTQYQGSFSCFELFMKPNRANYWGDVPWYLAPFGACYAVWEQVGSDPIVTSLSADGWFSDNGQAGVIGQRTIAVNPTISGFSTIYIPFVKGAGSFANVQYNMTWHQPTTGATRAHGWIYLYDFPDTTTFSQSSLFTWQNWDQKIYSAMVLPLIVYWSGSTPITFQLELSRNFGGTGVWLGRPIVLHDVACSWSAVH